MLTGAFALAALSAWAPAAAQSFEGPGIRAQGMGGAFVAVADDASAVWWNPAGLAHGPFFNMVLEHQAASRVPDEDPARLAHAALDRAVSGLAFGTPPLGLSYYRTRFTFLPAADPPNGRDTNGAGKLRAASLVMHQTGVTLLHSVAAGLVVGSTVKFVRGIAASLPADAAGAESTSALLDQAAGLIGRASNRLDADLGVHLASGPVRAGVTVRNLAEPTFRSAEGEELRLRRQARLGVAWLGASTVVAADLDVTRGAEQYDGEGRRLALGFEQKVRERLAVRGGYRVNLSETEMAVGTVGASVAVRSGVWLDGFWGRGGLEEHRWGLAARVAY